MDGKNIKKIISGGKGIIKALHHGKVVWSGKAEVVVIGDIDGCKKEDINESINKSSFATILASYEWEFSTSFYKKNAGEYIENIKKAIGRNFILIVGCSDYDSSLLLATEAKKRNILCYHVLEPEIKNKIELNDILEMMELVIDIDKIHEMLKAMRNS